jgi:hypothetical protein
MPRVRAAKSVTVFLCDNPDCCDVHIELRNERGEVFAAAVLDTSCQGLFEHFVSCWQQGEAKRTLRTANPPPLPH